MVQKKLRRLPPSVRAANRLAIKALLAMPDYQPSNPAYGLDVLQQIDTTLTCAEQSEANAQKALDDARNVLAETDYRAHDIVRHARAQVVVQYGEDSPNVQLVGLTRRSDYKKPAGRKPKTS